MTEWDNKTLSCLLGLSEVKSEGQSSPLLGLQLVAAWALSDELKPLRFDHEPASLELVTCVDLHGETRHVSSCILWAIQ